MIGGQTPLGFDGRLTGRRDQGGLTEARTLTALICSNQRDDMLEWSL